MIQLIKVGFLHHKQFPNPTLVKLSEGFVVELVIIFYNFYLTHSFNLLIPTAKINTIPRL